MNEKALQVETTYWFNQEIERNKTCQQQLDDAIYYMKQAFGMFRIYLRDGDIVDAEKHLILMPDTEIKSAYLIEIEKAKQSKAQGGVYLYVDEDVEKPAHRKALIDAYRKQKGLDCEVAKEARYAKYKAVMDKNPIDYEALKEKLKPKIEDIYDTDSLKRAAERYHFSLDNKQHANFLLSEAETKIKDSFSGFRRLIKQAEFDTARAYLAPMPDCESKTDYLNEIIGTEKNKTN